MITVKRGNIVILPLTTYYSDAVSYTAYCPVGTEGDSVTVNIAENTYTSTYSKGAATYKAEQAARQQAELQLVCTPVETGVSTLTDSTILTDETILID